jgi:hypothetical protein
MGDCNHCAVREAFTDRFLNQGIGAAKETRAVQRWTNLKHLGPKGLRVINVGSRLVDNQYLAFPQYGSCQAYELLLADTEVRPAFVDIRVQPVFCGFNRLFQMDL